MNHDEAKFLLRARRPGARDAGDERFTEALGEAARDPKLQAWHEAEERFDVALAAKLGALPPPVGLREAILAGGRTSVSPVGRGRGRWPWFAAAAAVAVLVALAPRFLPSAKEPEMELALLAMHELSRAHDQHIGNPPGLETVQAQLASMRRLRGHLNLDLDQLRRNRCRAVRIAGREAFEICFQRDGVWFHLYAMQRATDAADGVREAQQPGRERLVAAAWSDPRNSYVLVTDAGSAALRRVL